MRGEDCFVFPLERTGEVLSQWPGVRDCGLEGFRETLALMVLAGDLIFDTDHSPTYPLAVAQGGRRRFVCVRESRTAQDVGRLGHLRRWDAAHASRPEHERRGMVKVSEAEFDLQDQQALRREITRAVSAVFPTDPPRRRSGAWNPNMHLLEMAVRSK